MTRAPYEPRSDHASLGVEKCCAVNCTTEERRDRIQAQLDRWISRGFKGGGEGPGEATQKETAGKVSEVADLNRAIAEQEAKKRGA